YRLNDEDATHLQLLGEGGDVLLHLLVGSSDTGTRTFVRILGQDAPEGIFEVTGLAGRFDSLHGMLNLTPDGAPDPKQWLDLSAFDALPFSAVAQSITIRDGERRLTFERKAGSDPAGDEWQMTHPHSAQANGANVRSVVDVLMNLNATDIAGPLHPDGASLGVNNAEREIEIEYTDGADSATSCIYFGRQGDSRVAVLLKATNVGELVYWCPDYSVSRLFRPTGEFLDKQRV